MAKHGSWTVIFEDKMVIKKTGEFNTTNGRGYSIDDDTFWSQSKFDNIHAIQFTDDNVDNDQVEYKDDSANGSYDSNVLGNFNEFITRWDTAHLAALQAEWDEDNVEGETEAEKITRLGARPTSYSS